MHVREIVYLNSMMDRAEYIVIQIAILQQESVEKYKLQEENTMDTYMKG